MSTEITQNDEDGGLMVGHDGVSLEEAEVDGHFGGDTLGHSHHENSSSKDGEETQLGPEPVFSDDLPLDLKHRFDTLMDELRNGGGFLFAPTVEERERLTENFLPELRSTLQQFPILSRTVYRKTGWGLLYQALISYRWLLGTLPMSDILKCIIQANPHSLLWKKGGSSDAIHLARVVPRLSLWIAENYDWVLCDEGSGLLIGDDNGGSPLVCMAWDVVQGEIGVTEIKDFYDEFPAALFHAGFVPENLREDLFNFPLQVLLRGLCIRGAWSQEHEGLIMSLVSEHPGILRLVAPRKNQEQEEHFFMLNNTPLNEICFIISHLYQQLDEFEETSKFALGAPRAVATTFGAWVDRSRRSVQFNCDSACRLARTFLSMDPEMLSPGNYTGKHPISHLSKFSHHSEIQDLIIKMMRYHIVHTEEDSSSNETTQLPFLLDEEEHGFSSQVWNILQEELLVARRLHVLKGMIGEHCWGDDDDEELETPEEPSELAGRIFQKWMANRLGRTFALIPEVKSIRQSIEQVKVHHQKISDDFSHAMVRQFLKRVAARVGIDPNVV